MVPPLKYVLCVVLFNTVLLHDYTWYYFCSAWFLDIIISTCCCSYYYLIIMIVIMIMIIIQGEGNACKLDQYITIVDYKQDQL